MSRKASVFEKDIGRFACKKTTGPISLREIPGTSSLTDPHPRLGNS
jgi:hypothetical protein